MPRETLPTNPSWQDVERYSHTLRDRIVDSGYKADFMVPLSGGGWVVSGLLSLLLPYWVPAIGIEVQRIGENQDRRIGPNRHLNRNALRSANILLVEDLLETGKSVVAIRDFVEENGGNLRLACYAARDYTIYQPDYCLFTSVAEAIYFPYERFRGKRIR